MENKDMVIELIEKARKAQSEYENYSQEQVDQIVKAVAKTVSDNAEALAKLAVEETGMGVYEHKIKKNKGKARAIWHSLKDKKSVEVIEEDKENGIITIEKPMGIVGAVIPCTSPIVTPMCSAMFALKGRNAIIIAPHPKGKRCALYTVELINTKLKELDAPENLIQIVEEPDAELLSELMAKVDIVVAYGGMSMAMLAYSGGIPAYGVGAENVQCIVDRDADLKEAVPQIIDGRTFDNGIICSGEQMLIVHKDDFKEVVKELKLKGAYFIDNEEEKSKLRNAVFDENGFMNSFLAGQSIPKIAAAAGIDIPEDAVVIIVEVNGRGREDILCKEKMCPVIGITRYDSFEEAVDIAKANLELRGKGHLAVIHSNNNEHIKYAGKKLPIRLLLVNQTGANMNGGSFCSSLVSTIPSGCGAWGMDYKHFINITKILTPDNRQQPPDEEIWR